MGISQEVGAVSDLNINHPLFGLVFNKLIGYSLDGVSVTAINVTKQKQDEVPMRFITFRIFESLTITKGLNTLLMISTKPILAKTDKGMKKCIGN